MSSAGSETKTITDGLFISVKADDAIPAGLFYMTYDKGSPIAQLAGVAQLYGAALGRGACSCERIARVLSGMAEELDLSGSFEMRVGRPTGSED